MDIDAIVDSAAILTAIAYTVVLFRAILRRLKHEKFVPDDYGMVFALFFYTITTVSYPIILDNGTNVGIKDPTKLSDDDAQQGEALIEIKNVETTALTIIQVILGSKWAIVERLSYLTCVWTVKACILVYFTRLPLGRNSKLVLKAAIGTIAVTWIVCLLSLLEECIPLSLAWQLSPDIPQCATAVNAITIMSVTNIISDLLLMAIPIPTMIRSQFPIITKIQIAALYTMGVFVVVASLARMVVVLEDLGERAQLIWAQLECFFITVIANAPIIHGLYQHGVKHIRYRRYRSESCHMGSLTGDGGRDGGSGGEKREGRARRTWRRVSGRSNPLPEPDVIQCTVELVQRRETGSMDEEPKPALAGPGGKDFDIYTGDRVGQLPLARIESHAVPATKRPQNSGRRSRLFGRSKAPTSRKSIIHEAE